MSNLQNFLQSVTAIIPSKSLPRSYMNGPIGKETHEYFTLGDLWDSYQEWSAYGVGAPIALKRDETVVQYYAPYLSAIQIYTIKSPRTIKNLSGVPQIDGTELAVQSLSDASDSDKLSMTYSNESTDSNSSEPTDQSSRDRLGYIYFQYCEICTPVWRIPLSEKMFELSQKHRGLKTLKSVDLSPASWMAIAWYPIYHVPMKGITKNVSTCFLTYHTLSSYFQDNLDSNACKDIQSEKENGGIRLPPFGLAAYKMQNDIWLNNAKASEKFKVLQSAADSWIKQLAFNHYDFHFFNSYSNIMDNGF